VPVVPIWLQSQWRRGLARAGAGAVEAVCRNRTVARLQQLSRFCDKVAASAGAAAAGWATRRRFKTGCWAVEKAAVGLFRRRKRQNGKSSRSLGMCVALMMRRHLQGFPHQGVSVL